MKNKLLSTVIFASLIASHTIQAGSWSDYFYSFFYKKAKPILTDDQKRAIAIIQQLKKDKENIQDNNSWELRRRIPQESGNYDKKANPTHGGFYAAPYFTDVCNNLPKPQYIRAMAYLGGDGASKRLQFFNQHENESFQDTLEKLLNSQIFVQKKIQILEANNNEPSNPFGKEHRDLIEQKELISEEIKSFTNPDNRNAFTRSHKFYRYPGLLDRIEDATIAKVLIAAREDYDKKNSNIS
jgi:hypothetical protein